MCGGDYWWLGGPRCWLLRVMCDGGLVRAVLVMGDQGIRVDWVVLVNVGKYWDLGSVVSDV